MSCKNGSMPINVSPTNNKCKLSCFFKYDYGISSLIVTNKSNHLSFNYDAKTDITYNNEIYNVQDIRLYAPSLNTYNNKRFDAELIIHHISNTAKNLLVCIPIKSDGSKSPSEVLFDKIIPFSPSNVNERQSINVNNYTLNHFVPKAGYYAYKGSLPYQPCNGTYDILLFEPSSAINMNNTNMKVLNSVISKIDNKNDIKNIKDENYFYNEDGTLENEMITGDDIYIDCNEVDEDGNTVSQQDERETTNGEKKDYNIKLNEKTKKIMRDSGYVIGGIIGAYLLYFIWNKIRSKITPKE